LGRVRLRGLERREREPQLLYFTVDCETWRVHVNACMFKKMILPHSPGMQGIIVVASFRPAGKLALRTMV